MAWRGCRGSGGRGRRLGRLGQVLFELIPGAVGGLRAAWRARTTPSSAQSVCGERWGTRSVLRLSTGGAEAAGKAW